MDTNTLISLDFHNANTLHTTHGLHAFPAKFPPQLAEWAIEKYTKPGQQVCDPMAGSGTTLVEACRLGRVGIGFDIDPLACLIARVKCTPLAVKSLEQHNRRLIEAIEVLRQDYESHLTSGTLPDSWAETMPLPRLPSLSYWFLPQVQVALTLLKKSISDAQAPVEIKNLWYAIFSSLIIAKHSVANARDIVHSRHHFCQHAERPTQFVDFIVA